MQSDSDPRLLTSLPAGVEHLIIDHLSNGYEGSMDILNLRKLCKTTKSWVDNLPPTIARKVFSSLQVKLEIRTNSNNQPSAYISIEEFLKSAPPFGVSSLFLTIDEFSQTPLEQTAASKAWEAFGNYWASKLQFFTFKWSAQIVLPLTEVRTHLTRESLFSFLEKCTILRSCNFSTTLLEDLTYLRKVLEQRKTCGDLCIKIVLTSRRTSDTDFKLNSCLETQSNLGRLVEAAVQSNSSIQIEMLVQTMLPIMKKIVDLEIYRKFLKLIQILQITTLNLETKDLKTNFPFLKDLYVDYATPQDLSGLILPPQLHILQIHTGFLSPPNLPQSLTSIGLHRLHCTPNNLYSLINCIRSQCSRLESLYIKWGVVRTNEPILNMNYHPGFSELRALTFIGGFIPGSHSQYTEHDIACCQQLLCRTFEWEQLQLHYLALNVIFHNPKDSPDRFTPVINEELVSRINSGSSGKTLIRLGLLERATTRSAIQELKALKETVAANWSKHEETEGKGKWQDYKFPHGVEELLRDGWFMN